MGAKRGGFNPKTYESLNKLPTARLLSYYRAESERFRRFRSHVKCDCCGTMHWEFKPLNESDKEDQSANFFLFADWSYYLDQVKSILDKKDHILKR